jgi:hypothetical protein
MPWRLLLKKVVALVETTHDNKDSRRPTHPLSRIRERDDRGWRVQGVLCGRRKDAVAIGASAVSPAEDAIAVLPQDPEVAIPTSIELNRRISSGGLRHQAGDGRRAEKALAWPDRA